MSIATSQQRIFVTGGGGFLGTAVCRSLLQHGYRVVSYGRRYYPELAALANTYPEKLQQVRGDITDAPTLFRAMHDCTAVIHCAARAGIWGRFKDYYHSNVVGTECVLTAVQAHGIKTLVYTSSPSVVFAGQDITGADESLPYAERFLCAYPHTKKIAEQLVLAANGSQGLATLALRPHLLWGPGDPHFLPRLLDRARSGKLRPIGSRNNKVDVIFIDNAAKAHVRALEQLTSPTASCAGKAFFLGQEEPVNLWGFVDQLLGACGEQALGRAVPAALAYGMGASLEASYKALRIFTSEPPMTRFLALQLSKSHYFDHTNAEKHLGFFPEINTAKGLALLNKEKVT